MTQKRIYIQNWIEHERGWGIRPDGYTMHLTDEDRKEFIRQHWAREQAENPSWPAAPDCYSRPDNNSYISEVAPEIFDRLVLFKREGKVGMWGQTNHAPKPVKVTSHFEEGWGG